MNAIRIKIYRVNFLEAKSRFTNVTLREQIQGKKDSELQGFEHFCSNVPAI